MQKHAGMTNADFDALGRYVRDVANAMGLYDWQLVVSHRSPPEEEDGHRDSGAMCKPEYGKRYATIWFMREFREELPERQRQWIVHELLHCHFDNMDSMCHGNHADALGQIGFNLWWEGFNLAMEHCIDAVAQHWAPAFPLITWPTDK